MKKEKSQRQLQLGEHIKRIIADIFARNSLGVISGSYVTILEADVSPDIKNCRIFIDIFGDKNNEEEIVKKLNLNAGQFRHELAKQLTTRSIPEINFVLDKTGANANYIENLLAKEAKNFAKKNKK